MLEKLKASRDSLTQHVANVTAQLAKLGEVRQRLTDEDAELELRKQVGELTESEWANASARLRSDIAKIVEQQEVMSADVKRIQEILAEAPSARPSAAASAPAGAAAAPPTDELAFLKTVVGATTGEVPTAPRKSSVKPASRTSAPLPAPRPSAIKPIGPPPRPLAPGSPRASGSEPSLVEKPPPDVKIGATRTDEKPLAANVPDGDLQLKSSTAPSPTKKAKCPKCSGLNVPSDWYCVHCGAELAI